MQNSSSLQQRIIGTALLSASALFLEIVLTRLFSVLYFPPYVFLIISFAILGIGLGAALCAIISSLCQEKWLVIYSTGASVSSLILVIFSVLTASSDFQIVLFGLLIIPYIFVGLALSTLFSQYAEASHTLYMGDLIGAGIGAILTIPILNTFGPINGILVASVGFALSGVYFYSQRHMIITGLGIILAIGVLVSNVGINWINLDILMIATNKPITEHLFTGGKIVQTSWDAFARTDVIAPGDDSQLQIYVDGGAASIMPNAGQNPNLLQNIGFFPFATEQPQRVFIIGPGGGLDVWFALQSGASEITAVEVNPASVDMVKDYATINGQLYGQPAVEILTDDGRSVLQRVDTTYDLIYLSQVVTLAAERGGYALSENFIYTVDAFDDYLDKLSENGQIALKLYDEITLTRALSTAIRALNNQGLSDQEALQHIMIMIDNKANPAIPQMMIKKSAFTENDSLVLGAIARDVGFEPIFLPHVLVQDSLEGVVNGIDSYESIVNQSNSDISAPTDNRPYFFQFEYGIPQTLTPLALLVSIISVVGFGLYLFKGLKSDNPTVRFMPIYFAMLGIGFIAIEIFVIQQTRLFLGHPTFAVTLVLATFLIGGGIGSGVSQRLGKSLQNRSPFLIPMSVAIMTVLWSIIWNLLSSPLSANTLIIRGVFVVITLIPLTFVMGIPFALGLRLVESAGQRQIAIAWAVNGMTTVIGTVVAVIISIISGFTTVLIMGIIAYLIATSMLIALRRYEG